MDIIHFYKSITWVDKKMSCSLFLPSLKAEKWSTHLQEEGGQKDRALR
jgi:hypothetical protein